MTNGEIDMNQVQALRYELGAWKKCAEARGVLVNTLKGRVELRESQLAIIHDRLELDDGEVTTLGAIRVRADLEMTRHQLSVARHNLHVIEDNIAQLAAERDAARAAIADAMDTAHTRALALGELEAAVDRHIGARRLDLKNGGHLAAETSGAALGMAA